MYRSGIWRGFWKQEHWGQQPMEEFELHFSQGLVRGHGVDAVGRFTFHGEYCERTGTVQLIKQYIGRHTVNYFGEPTGEGTIVGQWSIVQMIGEQRWEASGPFLLEPELPHLNTDSPVIEIVPRSRR